MKYNIQHINNMKSCIARRAREEGGRIVPWIDENLHVIYNHLLHKIYN